MKRLTFILLIILIISIPVLGENDFIDVEEGSWYSDWVNDLVNENITSGYPDGTFKPTNQLKRIELLSFTMKALGYDLPVSDGYWGQNIIDKAIELKIISNSDLMATDPNGFVTREETAYVIYNAYTLNNDMFDSETEEQAKLMISDFDDVDSKYSDGVIGVFSEGIVSGYDDKSFKPNKELTRAEAAVFISRLIKPEKRVKFDFDLNKFVYETTSTLAKDFTTYYSSEHQDIYNILELANAIENEDVEQGFAYITNSNLSSVHTINFHSSLYNFDNMSLSHAMNDLKWIIQLRKIPPTAKYTDWIQIHGWGKENEMDHEVTLKKIFDYLFAEDSLILWEKYIEISSSPDTGQEYEYTGNHNSRYIRISQAGGSGAQMFVTRIENAQPINVQQYKE